MQPILITSVGRSNNERRFSDEQVKSLEYIFESEARPESRTKQRLADELGLHPRQVAIWFQNKRARSKAKQIELEYIKLKAEYETLASSYESMIRENQLLLVQFQKLKNRLGKHHEDLIENSKSENMGTTETKERPSQIYVPSEDVKSRNVENTVTVEEHPESSGNWYKYESGFLDGSSSPSPWWELWA